MNKLFVDDVRDLPDNSWMLARTISHAKKLLATTRFDVVSLDHDMWVEGAHKCQPGFVCDACLTLTLNETIRRLGCEHIESGSDLARWMVKQMLIWPKLIIIHSANPYGAIAMHDILIPYTKVKVL